MNPLTVTWAPHVYSEVGWQNFQALIHAGLNNVLGTPDGLIHRALTRIALAEMGDPFQPFIYGQVWFPVQIAVGYDIPLIMDGKNGKVEYEGNSATSDLPAFELKEIDDFWSSNTPVEHWAGSEVHRQDLNYYLPPDKERIAQGNIARYFFSYYKN